MRNLILLLLFLILLLPSSGVLAEKSRKNKNFVIPLPININQASADMLDLALDGIGAKKAQAIVDYRELHGPFQTVEDLTSVKGIGAGTLERNLGRITVD